MDYVNQYGLGGRDNQGGTTQVVYYAPLSYFANIKGFKAVPSIPGCLEIDGDHTFKAGKGWHQMYITMDSSKLTGELTGERDGRGYNFKFEGFHPGGKKEFAAFARQAKNDQFICLVKSPNLDDANKYITYQIGTKDLFAEMSAKFDTGTLSGGRNGFTVEIVSFANGLIFYDGVITEFPVAPEV